MSDIVEAAGLKIDSGLYALVRDEIIPGTGIEEDAFWQALANIVRDLGPRNHALLERRNELQDKIDAWHRQHRDKPIDPAAYRRELIDIGYLLEEGPDFQVTTADVDPEIANMAGPQLVVPVDNARYALNAANARWGSLYDALYGTDVIPTDNGAGRSDNYNPLRGARVVVAAAEFLDETVSLATGSFTDARGYALRDTDNRKVLAVSMSDGSEVGLAAPEKFVGYLSSETGLRSILLANNGLHIEIQIDAQHPIGQSHPAGVKDIILESAITTIQDCEDSVSAVDAADKIAVYRNWCSIMRGTLEAEFEKGGRLVTRRLNPDRTFTTPVGDNLTLPGRSTLLVRNVAIHMFTDAVTTTSGEEIPEGFLDAMVTSLAAIHDLKRSGDHVNSKTASIYIVKPKLHGPDEVAATVELFRRVEEALDLTRNTLKIGIMDEERRTTINLKEAIRVASDRVFFINTGFLDRTGDEIHTSIEAGPVLPKGDIKSHKFLPAYENWNVDIGLETALPGHGQIGKGMWTMPDRMREMLDTKVVHPQAGATTAWVPSPTAATLHAMHYHRIDVAARQRQLATRPRASLADILTPPLLDRQLDSAEIQRELDNNAQGILGYVVRWVDQGVGCSKVPDISNIGLMEDRATLRISSQHLANWLYHGIITREQLDETFQRMAQIVDGQNAGDPAYRNMAPDFASSIAYQAALDLVLKGREIPNGYTEPVLHQRRREVKAQHDAA